MLWTLAPLADPDLDISLLDIPLEEESVANAIATAQPNT